MKRRNINLEHLFYLSLIASHLPKPALQFKAVEGRDYAWDFAWPEHGLLVELNGGTWIAGGHSTGAGQRRDSIKQNLAALHGFKTMAITTDMIRDGTALAMLETFFKHRPVADVIGAGKRGYSVPFKAYMQN